MRNYPEFLTLQTQMRSGTHFFSHLLYESYGAKLFWRDNVPMSLEDIKKGLYDDDVQSQEKRPSSAIKVYQCHYYHDLAKYENYAKAPRICLVSNPFDSFYSDAVVLKDKGEYTPAPSRLRSHITESYVFQQGSNEWNDLLENMIQNAQWYRDIAANKNRYLILRYEDIIDNFDAVTQKLEQFIGPADSKFTAPNPSKNRIYWKKNYTKKYDIKTLQSMYNLFKDGIVHFYPELKDELANFIQI